MITKKVRGVRDILPEQVKKIRTVIDTCETIVKTFGFQEVILPTIENVKLYEHTIGETTDIVEKQMFRIIPRNDSDDEIYVLRPEGTAGIVRMYKENNLKNLYPVKRFFYFGPMFRYERPQKGRFREFYQFGIEIFDEPQISSDFVIVKIISMILEKLKVKYELEVNSIGCNTCRKEFINVLVKELNKIKDKICDVCQQRLVRNPLRILDCKKDYQLISQELDLKTKLNIENFLCKDCKNDYEKTLVLMQENNITYKKVPSLVRGLDYYNGFVFEFKSLMLESAQNTICAGGRYDSLISQVDPETKYACGAAFGVDRLIEVVQVTDVQEEIIKIGIAIVNDNYISAAFKIVDKIMNNKNFIILGPVMRKSLKAQLRMFNNEKCKYVIIVGDEINQGRLVVKDFVRNLQKEVPIDEVISVIV